MKANGARSTDETVEAPHGDDPTDFAGDSASGAIGPDTLIGSVLAERYTIDRRLGSGGMGAVYAGTHRLLARPIAVKVMKPRHGDDFSRLAQRFVQEARTASGIAHAHVVEITDFGVAEDGTAFLVMEHLDGEDLAATLQRDGPLPWRRVVHIGEQIARAIAAAHRQGVIHRDIKPANCFRLTRDDDPDFIKVLDFGLAKVTGDDAGEQSLTQTGALLGTPGYIAPELYRGLPADHRVDIFALGTLMYKLLTGQLPPMRVFAEEPAGASGPEIPPALQALLRRALADDPAERHPSAQALAADLKALAIGTGVSLDTSSAVPTARGSAVSLRRGRRLRVLVGAPVVGALVVAGGLLLYTALTREPAPAPEPDPAPIEAPPVAAPPVPEDTPKAAPASTPPAHHRKPRPSTAALPSILDDASTGPTDPPARDPALPGLDEVTTVDDPKPREPARPVPEDIPAVGPPGVQDDPGARPRDGG